MPINGHQVEWRADQWSKQKIFLLGKSISRLKTDHTSLEGRQLLATPTGRNGNAIIETGPRNALLSFTCAAVLVQLRGGQALCVFLAEQLIFFVYFMIIRRAHVAKWFSREPKLRLWRVYQYQPFCQEYATSYKTFTDVLEQLKHFKINNIVNDNCRLNATSQMLY